MTDLDRLIAVLENHSIDYEISTNKFDKFSFVFSEKTTFLVSDENEVLAMFLYGLSDKATADFFDKVLNTNSKSHQLFSHLRYLYFRQCSLYKLPDSFQMLSHIEVLHICFSHLQYLPEWLPSFSNLRDLDISGNNLETLPDWLQNLNNLKILNLYSNRLKYLPEWLHSFTELEYLDVSLNPLETIPTILLDLLQKTVSFLSHLSIFDVPNEVIEQGWEAIRQYYAERDGKTSSDDNDVPFTNTELKVMIIGAGSSGKSSISKALNNDEHNPNEASTVGIALKNILCKFQEQDWTLRVWDFGGQEAYAATQTLFMTTNTLYLVVADGRTENRPDPYLSYIDTFSPGSPVILIINKVDENERADLNRQVYLNQYSNLHPNMIRFSCVNNPGKCVQELLEEIESIVFGSKYGPQLQAQWPLRWRTVRSALIDLLEKNKTYIEASTFYDICKNEGIPDNACDTVRNACNISGIVFSYQNENTSPQINRIMHPEWVTKGINSLCKLPENGLYLNKDIYSHMRNQNYNDDETLSILAILQAEELAIPLTNKFFIPALLPSNPPSNFPENFADWHLDEKGEFKNSEFRFRYPFLHPIVKQTFMVRLLSSDIRIHAFRYGAWWNGNGVRVVMMEENDDLAFYLQGDNVNSLQSEQGIIQGMMERLHKNKNIKSALIHVFRAIDESGESTLSAEYPNEDLWKLKDIMNVDNLPLPGINRILPVNEILAGYSKNQYRERMHEMAGNTTIIHGNQTIMQNSPGATAIGGDAEDNIIAPNVVSLTVEKALFDSETNEAINIIKTMRFLNENHRSALITLLKEANSSIQSDDEHKQNICKEKFAAFILGAGKAVNKALKALSGLSKIAAFFGLA